MRIAIATEVFLPAVDGVVTRLRRTLEELARAGDEVLVLLYVGRLAKEKTVEHLLEAVRHRDGVALALVGDGPLRRRLERAFRGTPTTFLGFLDGDQLVHAYASADAFVHPSVTETLGMVTLEAHAAGLPVIAADSPAARELIRDGVDGLRYDPCTPGSLNRAVDRLAGNPALHAVMAHHTRGTVENATWTQATAVLRDYYAQAHDATVSDALVALLPFGEPRR